MAPDCLHLTRKDRLNTRRNALLERNRVMSQIESALARMEIGQFGVCTQCDGPIPQDRLEADPAVVRCPDCLGIC